MAALQPFLPWLGAALEDRVGGNAQCVWDAEELAELIEQGQSKAGVAAQLDLHFRKSGLQSRDQSQQHGHDASMTGGVSRSESACQQTSGVALEDQHRVIHVLTIGTVEEAELLAAMSGIVGGVDVQQDLTTFADLLAAETNELLQQSVVQAYQIAARRCILPAAESRLGTERLSQLLIGDDLQERIVAQAVGVVGVFVSGNDLVD